jgi:hypothetical protein
VAAAVAAQAAPAAEVAAPAAENEDGAVETDPVHDTPPDVAPVPPPTLAAFTTPFGDLTGEGEIKPHEAAAAAEAASRIPRIVADDPARSDEALAAEVALAVETETSMDRGWAQIARGPDAFDAPPEGPDDEVTDDDVEEVHELSEPAPDADPDAK